MGQYKNMIAVWSGAIGTIPAGWQLCDGTNGTPNLHNRFIIGSQGALETGNVGGDVSHRHNFTTDGHSHDIDPGGGFAPGTDYSWITNTVQVTGLTDLASNLPPYHILAFIMRMS